MAFTLDRNTASDRLGVSTRTLDRYVKANRIRTKRIGKKIFLHEEDVEAIRTADMQDPSDDYIIIHDDESDTSESIQNTGTSIANIQADIIPEFTRLYTKAQDTIREKDQKIEDLSYRLGQAQTKLGHSVDTNEYRRATYLLETTRAQRNTEVSTLQNRIKFLENSLTNRKKSFGILFVFFVLSLCCILGILIVYYLL
ncbi:hypothetical protein CSB09_04425 [Candidatus Gracilibacteria bacterium]|nr:MAG: hypothetical protein CSB09_04425 [Candidatus Gracilibacteria bacterium]